MADLKNKVKARLAGKIETLLTQSEESIAHDWGSFDKFMDDVERNLDTLRILSAPLSVIKINQV